jgi:hypothetical protein
MRLVASLLLATLGCSSPPPPPAPAAPAAPVESPSPLQVLADRSDKAHNTVEFHALIGPLKHDEAQAVLEYLYRYLMQRRDPPPAGFEAHLYTDEAQMRANAPVASLLQKPGAIGPTFDNKIPLEFWQQIQNALPKGSRTTTAQGEAKGRLPVGRDPWVTFDEDPGKRAVTVYVPYTEPGKSEYAESLSYHLAINVFCDTARALFDDVPSLEQLTFVGRWNDADVVRITLERDTYEKLHLEEVEDSIGQIHGRAFYELAANASDAEVTRNTLQRMAAAYRKMLGKIAKSRVYVSPKLK